MGFVTVFQVLTGENWNEVMYTGLTASGQIAWVYFVLLNLVGNYMVLNLFLAILLARFDNPGDDEAEDEDNLLGGHENVGSQVVSAAVAPMPDNENTDGTEKSKKDVNGGELKDDDSEVNDFNEDGQVDPNKIKVNPHAKSCFVLALDNPLRSKMIKTITAPWFDNMILFLIGISTLCLMLDEPRVATCKDLEGEESCNGLFQFLWTSDLVLNILFTIEMTMKMIALGVIGHRYAYLRNGWNILDFTIVIISWVTFLADADGALKALKSLRSLRALRPLRVVSRNPGMKLVVNQFSLHYLQFSM